MPILYPEDFGAVGGGTDDGAALQAWANALRDGGVGIPDWRGYLTSQNITFMPSTNTGLVTGPRIIGNLKLTGHTNLPSNTDLLHVYNPDAVRTSQNFYSPTFDSLELSNTTGTGNGVAFRGFWGSVGRISGTSLHDAAVFPNFLFNGIPDEYESMCNLGDVTGTNCAGTVYRNLIGVGASVTMHNVRGTDNSPNLMISHGVISASGSEKITGCIANSGRDWAVVIDKPVAPGIQAIPHEIAFEGNGDIDASEYGFYIANLEHGRIWGHRMNVEPPNFGGLTIPSWPIIAYSFGAGSGTIKNVTVDPYLTIRPGVTPSNIGTLFRFNNNPNITNLVLNVTMTDQTGLWASLPFASKYSAIHPSAKITIVENGVVVH
jgi:hypothetical protein